MTGFHMPSAAELYALERRARRERAEAMGALFRSAAGAARKALVNAFTKPYAPRPKGVQHA